MQHRELASMRGLNVCYMTRRNCTILKYKFLAIFLSIVLGIAIFLRTSFSNSGNESFNSAKLGQALRSDIDVLFSLATPNSYDTTPYNKNNLLPPFFRYTEKFE
ncbi:unnamed protein product, partial [Strongylus vulgaris]